MKTASICVQLWQNKFYLNVIIADTEEQFFEQFFIPISERTALTINSETDTIYRDIEITPDMVTA